MTEPFVHLHVHSDYSLLDGGNKVERLVDLAAEQDMEALALTDHGVLFGAIDFYKKAKKKGIKPIIGCEVYVAPGERTARRRVPGEPYAYHLTLLAQDYEGYENLCRLSSEGYLSGFYMKPRVDHDLIEEMSDGLICLSGCLKSEVCSRLDKGRYDEALDVATWYRDLFGDRYYVELMDHGLPQQKKVNEGLKEIAHDLSVPVVATNDVHYPEEGDDRLHEVLLCINTGKTLDDESRMRLSTDEFYFKSAEEMAERFPDHPEAITNTKEIADRCEIEFDLGAQHLPPFECPGGKDPETYLRELCEEGLRERYGEITGEVRDRFEEEFGVISRMNFVSYFLITWDFIDYARDQGIPVGPGRGSAAGSIIAYSLGITDIDPLEYDLLFERFLNKDRVSMPDIDIDFCKDRREEVIEYVRDKYGEECVSQIITFNVMKAKAAIRDVGRVMGLPLPLVDEVAKLVPDGPGVTLDDALASEPDLAERYENDGQVRHLIDMALKVEGLKRHAGIHAAGVVIGDGPLIERVPLYVHKGDLATQYSMDHLEDIGLLKMDFLGLRTLTLIEHCLDLVEETRGERIDIDAIPLDDRPTYELFQRAETRGVFQMESSGFRDLLGKLRPDAFDDLVALVALYRPGPLGSGLVDAFCRRKHGEEEVSYPHPELEPILEETYGVCVYQEQAMRIANHLAGFSLSDADSLRKAMGKKKMKLMARYQEQFVEGCVSNGVERAVADDLWAKLEQFAKYAFNKSHSAAYAYVSYQTAYLKANYPVEFMAALLTSWVSDTDKVVEYIAEAERMDIPVRPPDVHHSGQRFGVREGEIVYALSAIKGVGEGAVTSIEEAREEVSEFRSLIDVAEEVDLRLCNRATFEALIKAGAFDSLGVHRAALVARLDRVMSVGAQAQADREAGQKALFGASAADDAPEAPAAVASEDVPSYTDRERLRHEKEVLGFYLSGHPVDKRREEFEAITAGTVADLLDRSDGGQVAVGALIAEVRKRHDRRGNPMAFLTLEDRTGVLNGVVFSSVFEEVREKLVEDEVAIFSGKLQTDREEPSLLVDEILTIEEARTHLAPNVQVEIPPRKLEDESLDELRRIFRDHKGQTPVYLTFRADGNGNGPVRVRVRVGRDYFVRPDDRFRRAVTDHLESPRAVRIGATTV